MQIDKFFAGLSSQFENWGTATLAPKDPGLEEIANSIQQGNTVNFYQLVLTACGLLGPGEAFCEIGKLMEAGFVELKVYMGNFNIYAQGYKKSHT